MTQTTQKERAAEGQTGRPKDMTMKRGQDSTMLQAALLYAAEGLSVFPVNSIGSDGECTCGKGVKCRTPGKHPLIDDWQHKATRDGDTIHQWFRKHPYANIACHVGKSGMAVIDIDPRNGGNESFAQLQREHGPIAAEMEALTGGGGNHLYFRAPANAHLPAKLADGIDLQRGDKYVVLPPSRHASGKRYAWADGKGIDARCMLDDLPEWCATGPRLRVVQAAVSDDLEDDMPEMTRALNMWRGEVSERDFERVTGALKAIPPDDRETWRNVGAALKEDFGEDGRELWDEWAQTSSKYDDSDQEQTWNGFTSRPGGVTIATIFHLAQKHGWKEERKEVTSNTNGPDTGGDTSNGRRFARAYRGLLKYCWAVKKWLLWKGVRWVWCEGGEAIHLAKSVATALFEEAAGECAKNPSDGERRRLQQALTVLNNARRLDAMVSLAASEPGMGVPNPGMLDADPWLAGVRNGVINLRTATLVDADPAMLITKQVAATFDPSAECPMWREFLMDIFNRDLEVISFIQRALGYTLTGLVDEEVLFFMYGHGANGKSVFANIIHAVFGDYAQTVGPELIARSENNEGDRHKMKLFKARLVLANEVGSGDVWDDRRVKDITSREPISARPLYGEVIDFMPTHATWIRGNHKPGILDAGDGMWRRIVLIAFKRQFAIDERIPDLDRRILDAERDGILRWVVDGCIDWQRGGGLRIPAVIAAETAAYRADTDMLGEWVDECCEQDWSERAAIGEAYEGYKGWLIAQGVRYPSRKVFARQMAERGFDVVKSHGTRYFEGLRLRVSRGDSV
ncbi:phage/plasmid primase, P4 family [Paraburkholderia aspalathi]|uniref:Phage/plasmid primase, P4 family, C-terminal domain-containing protein n=1 Tax=Paraburkholderia aspalathi TaxID=1324617 RepID=A0A1I7EGU8_9BURK|nr:phage/plasmid primase, P4 family [Paraburkholderia aspalathi]SFU23164.1 phage/plasmid primase, P4 family, C-terminal domain-containing protein [Paraburkholderia aspalathi]